MLPQVCIHAQQAHIISPRKLKLFQVRLVILFAERSMRASARFPVTCAHIRAHMGRIRGRGRQPYGAVKAHSSPIQLSVRIRERPSEKLPKPRHF